MFKTKNKTKQKKGRVQNCYFFLVAVVSAVGSLKLAIESALLSRRFHSIVVRGGKKVFVLGNVAQWGT